MMVLNMDINSNNVLVKQEISERKNCMFMDKQDAAVQTSDFDIAKAIAKIVESRLKKIQQFETEELKEKFSKIEEENRNLKRREIILEKRLVELEQTNKKRKEVGRKSDDNMKTTNITRSLTNLENNGIVTTTEMIDKDFCPTLFKPAETQKAAQPNNVREKLTQMVTPMPKTISNTNILPQSVYSLSTIAAPLLVAHSMPVAKNPPNVPRMTVAVLNTDMAIAKSNIPVQQTVYAGMIGNKNIVHSYNSVDGRQMQSLKRPPPNINIGEYRPLSKTFRFQQYRGPPDIPPRLLLQPRLRHAIVNYGPPLSMQPPQQRPPPPQAAPPAYNESMNVPRLPQLTATITSDASNVILTWDCFNVTAQFQCNVQTYFLFAYHTIDLSTPPPAIASAWKRIGIIQALPLPIACTLTQTFTGHNYYFAVAAVDNQGLIGPLSNACTLKVTL